MTEPTSTGARLTDAEAELEKLKGKNKDVVRTFIYELWCRGNLSAIDELCAPQFELHDPSLPSYLVLGRRGLKELANRLRTAFPDFDVTVEDQFAEGDKVVTRVTQRGTQEGPLQDLPATRRRIRVSAVSIDRVVDGKIVSSWGSSDGLSLLQQLGAIPGGEPVA